MRFVSLGQVFCLQLPSDSASPRTPLLLANLYFCLRGSGLTPYSSCTCRAHIKKTLAVTNALTYTAYCKKCSGPRIRGYDPPLLRLGRVGYFLSFDTEMTATIKAANETSTHRKPSSSVIPPFLQGSNHCPPCMQLCKFIIHT